MSAHERMMSLQTLASHPATPPHEAAAARLALERLEAKHGPVADALPAWQAEMDRQFEQAMQELLRRTPEEVERERDAHWAQEAARHQRRAAKFGDHHPTHYYAPDMTYWRNLVSTHKRRQSCAACGVELKAGERLWWATRRREQRCMKPECHPRNGAGV